MPTYLQIKKLDPKIEDERTEFQSIMLCASTNILLKKAPNEVLTEQTQLRIKLSKE